MITTLLSAGVVAGAVAVAGTSSATGMAPVNDGGICGAWEPRGGAGSGFQRLCIDGNLYWYEYR